MTESEQIELERQRSAVEADRTYQAAAAGIGTPAAIATRLQAAAEQAQQRGGSQA